MSRARYLAADVLALPLILTGVVLGGAFVLAAALAYRAITPRT